ncbi:ABC transporter permease [Marinilabiliaceae bacterium JC017]|nr:ABC transporter permease [Marinilabiliaceae bacterium JC017]
MRTILYLLQKEFLQVFRNKTMLPLIFVLPVVQLVVLVNAATMEMKNIRVTVVDEDLSSVSRQLVAKLDASLFFDLQSLAPNRTMAFDRLKKSESDVLLIIPPNTARNLERQQVAKVQIITDAINATQAQLGYSYLGNVLMDLSRHLQMERAEIPAGKQINVSSSFWFNPELNYRVYMLPGILVILVTIIGLFLSAMNLVREKEIGTSEQINVTPIRKYQFIIGKLVPFWIIGLVELALGLIVGKLLYQIPMVGNLAVLFAFGGIYLVAILGLGLLLSTITNTQQQVMLLSFFFMLIFVMMSGVFTSVDNMPLWAQWVNKGNPLYYFMNVMRMVLLKGAGFRALAPEFTAITIYALISVPLAILNYRKTS